MGWHVGSGGDGGVGGNPKIVLSPLSGRAMERIEGSETSNQEFGPVPVQTLKFNLGVSILLGEGGGVFRVCVCVCGSNHTCQPDVHRFSVVGVLDDFGGDMAKIAGERGELLVGTMKEFRSAKR